MIWGQRGLFVRSVDLWGIVDHHCFKFLFIIASFIYFSEGLSAGGIAGIVMGILLPLILMCVFVLWMLRNRNKFT